MAKVAGRSNGSATRVVPVFEGVVRRRCGATGRSGTSVTRVRGDGRSLATVDHPFSGILNAARTVVFSRTLTTAEWANTSHRRWWHDRRDRLAQARRQRPHRCLGRRSPVAVAHAARLDRRDRLQDVLAFSLGVILDRPECAAAPPMRRERPQRPTAQPRGKRRRRGRSAGHRRTSRTSTTPMPPEGRPGRRRSRPPQRSRSTSRAPSSPPCPHPDPGATQECPQVRVGH